MRNVLVGISLFSSLFTTPLLAQTTLCQEHHCIGVVDVGSTGSRLHFYTYDLDANQSPIQIKEQWSKKVTPGFSTIELTQAKIDDYLSDLFSNPIEDTLPVYFYATAGMRLLPASSQYSYYEGVKKWFASQPNLKLMDAKTITGRDEGVFGWLAVNYNLNTLTNPSSTPIGVMDMGGASVQIVFPVDNPITLPKSRVAQFNLYGKRFTLYSYSALGLGQTLVNQQFLNQSTCFSHGYSLADGEIAQGDAVSCQQEVSHLVNDVHHVADELGLALDASSKKWYASGGITYLAQNSLFNFKDSWTSSDLLAKAQKNVCQESWSVLQNISTSDTLYNVCLNASYYYALMVNGYGISQDTIINMSPKGSDWTTGVVLLH